MKSHIITGLDIGTSSIKALTVLKKPNSLDLEVLRQSEIPSSGVRKGSVVDVGRASNNIRKAIEQLQEGVEQKIDDAYINIGGVHVFAKTSHGSVAVSRADRKISQEDIERVLQGAQAISLPSNKEILDILPKYFIVDGESGIAEPRDMQGIRLEVEALLFCAFSPYLKNLTNAVMDAGIQIADIIPSPSASAKAVLTLQQKELGVVVVDIGAGTTSMAVYEEGNLIHMAIFPFGSVNITNDIAIGLRTDINFAENIKRQFGSCFLEKVGKKEKIELPKEPSPLVFYRKDLVKIIEARVSEIFDQVNKELKKIARQELLPAGVVLTGGGAKLSGLVEFAKKELKLPVRIGVSQSQQSSGQGFVGLEENPALSTVCGLVLGGVDLEGQKSSPVFSGGGIGAKLKKVFRIFMP